MRLPWLKPADGASRKGLRRELIAALAIKLLALLALWLLFFSRPALHDMRTGMAPDRVADMGDKFVVSYMEAPMQPANEAMAKWVEGLPNQN